MIYLTLYYADVHCLFQNDALGSAHWKGAGEGSSTRHWNPADESCKFKRFTTFTTASHNRTWLICYVQSLFNVNSHGTSMGPLHIRLPTSGLVYVYVCACARMCAWLFKQLVWQSKTDGHMSVQCVCELCFQGMKQTSNAIFITAVWQ